MAKIGGREEGKRKKERGGFAFVLKLTFTPFFPLQRERGGTVPKKKKTRNLKERGKNIYGFKNQKRKKKE